MTQDLAANEVPKTGHPEIGPHRLELLHTHPSQEMCSRALLSLFLVLPGVSTESISLWSSRVLTVDETTRMTVTDGVFPTIRGVATRGVASRITIVSTAAQSAEDTSRFHACAQRLGSPAVSMLGTSVEGPMGTLADAEAHLTPVCKVTWVGDKKGSSSSSSRSSSISNGGEEEEQEGGSSTEAPTSTMTFEEYEAAVSAPVGVDEKGCQVYLLSQLPLSLCSSSRALLGEDSRVLRMTALVSWTGRGRGLAGGVGAAAAPIAAAGKGGNTTALGITMVPVVLEGLFVGALLVFFALVGLSCVTSITSPDILMSTSLPAGKEY